MFVKDSRRVKCLPYDEEALYI